MADNKNEAVSKPTKSNENNITKPSKEFSILTDPRYNRTVAPLIMDALEKRRDLVQLPNGDIIITEQKTISIRYEFNDEKCKMVRATTGRSKRSRSKSAGSDFDFDINSEFDYDAEKEEVNA